LFKYLKINIFLTLFFFILIRMGLAAPALAPMPAAKQQQKMSSKNVAQNNVVYRFPRQKS
jgi:hypothetical protein